MPKITRLRRYLNEQGKGAVSTLARKARLHHTYVSRLADGHREKPSLAVALALSRLTDIAPDALLEKVTTPKGATASRSRQGRNR